MIPTISDFKLWIGKTLGRGQWNYNFSQVITYLTSGLYDLVVNTFTAGDITASTITANSYLPYSYMRRTAGDTRGATNTNVVIYSTAAESSGTDITYVNSATLGDSFLVNTSGIYSVSVNLYTASTGWYSGIKVGILNNAGIDTYVRSYGIANSEPVWDRCWVGYIPAGSSVWTYCNTAPSNDATNTNQITITRLR